jgi:hypothetical protein
MKASGKPATRTKLKSLSHFAHQVNPFDTPQSLLQRLRLETSESKHLEWKVTRPFGPNVTKKIKCRVVKALVSFANTDGGFIVFGVDPAGKWTGFTEAELKDTDPAMIAELVNEHVAPELFGLNYGVLRLKRRFFPTLHVPPSGLMPHVNTKEVVERQLDGRSATYLQRHAVYCRYQGKSDLATASQYARIIARRTEMLRAELLRRVKQVNVASLGPSRREAAADPIVRVSRITFDKSAPAMRITRDPTEASELLVHEELSDSLFTEINNVLETNRLLASNGRQFVFGEDIYYRIYAERQHVDPRHDNFQLLATTALSKLYAPALFWVIRLPAKVVAGIMNSILANPRSNYIHMVCRIAVLLGPRVTEWLAEMLESDWKNHAQPPDHYFSFKKMKARSHAEDRRLIVLQQSSKAKVTIPAAGQDIPLTDLLDEARQASDYLSKTCLAIFNGDHTLRSLARQLDVIAYGADFCPLETAVADALEKTRPMVIEDAVS